MVSINAQSWLTTKVTDWKNTKQIYGTKDGKYSREEKDREFLAGDLVVENLNKLEELILYDVRELNKVIIRNCSELKKISLFNSGVKQLEIGSGLDRIEELNIGFEVNPIHRPIIRKLDDVDLSKITNLKTLKCVGVQETKLIGFEKLNQLEYFRGDEKVKIPNFSKWKEKLDIITNPTSGLDLLKGGSGSDKDDIDPAKLNDYKVRPTQGQLDNAKNKVKEYEDGLKTDLKLNDSTLPNWRNEIAKLKNPPASNNSGVPITKDQWDNDYKNRPTRQELEKVQRLHDAIKNGAINKFKDEWKKSLEIEDYYNQIEQLSK